MYNRYVGKNPVEGAIENQEDESRNTKRGKQRLGIDCSEEQKVRGLNRNNPKQRLITVQISASFYYLLLLFY